MELWRQCAHWLIQCRVLPPNHRVTFESAQVCDLAQALRDGVLLCQLLNNLIPHAVNLREINLRPQMSQFLCLKNIRMFLSTCSEKFGLRKSELFEVFDLFDVQDFAKVCSPVSPRGVCVPFPTEESEADDNIYRGLSDQIDDTVEEDDDLYDCVENEEAEGDEIYEDLMRSDQNATPVTEVDKRSCCLQEIRQTEEKYTETLESICQVRQPHARHFEGTAPTFCPACLLQDLLKVHRYFLEDLRSALNFSNAQNLYQVFIKYKERFLLYGRYCSQVEAATKHLDQVANASVDVRMRLEECSQRANKGRFTLRDLLMVPMQRVLKYHLLLQELVKHTTEPTEKENLRLALDAMRDLAQCVNEVKRDNETIKQITNFQLSIENLAQSLAQYGRPNIDGELKVVGGEKRSKMDRYAFLLDKALLICKRKGDSYDMRNFINLPNFQIRDDSVAEKDNKKVTIGVGDGTFYQGYRCTRCRAPAHKECLGRLPHCGKPASGGVVGFSLTRSPPPPLWLAGLPKMEVFQEYLGLPPPPVAFGPPLRLNVGDIVELTKAEAEQLWWEGRNTSTNEIGWFLCKKVKPYVSVSSLALYAGLMERAEAEQILTNRSDGTFLVRQRVKDAAEFAISIKFNVEIKHIKILTAEGLYRITEKKAFKGTEFGNSVRKSSWFGQPNWSSWVRTSEPRRGLKYFGSAKARYDFCARDRTELSLKEGDIIKIISKKGQQGWWRGEIYGRVGWFPSNYVEEDYSEYC
uniref:Vav guanine nucleotide exchange factor 1 n=1 Tax=Sphenodon punctatus TaxID=8508 RepID=A0A8D0GX67_SPHPU